MNSLPLLTGPVGQALGWALVHLLWQATAAAAALALVLSRMSRRTPNARYIAGCTALALVFVTFVGTALRAYAPLAPSTEIGSAIGAGAATALAAADRTAVATWSSLAQPALPWIVGLWLTGVAVLSTRLYLSWWSARGLVRGGTPVGIEEWERRAARLGEALGIRRAVRLLESASLQVPAVVGSLRPVILLPASALSGLTPEQIEMVLAHELAHIRRHDFLLNLLQSAVETLLFFHPAVWWISRRVRIEREHCCDDLTVGVCGSPVQYARALTRLEELRAQALPVAVAANGGSLLERVRRIAGPRVEPQAATSHWTVSLAVLWIALVAVVLPSPPSRAQRGLDLPVKVEIPVATIVRASAPDQDDATEEDDREGERHRVQPTVEELIGLRAAGVTRAYIDSMREFFPGVSLQKIASLGSVGVTPEFVRAMRAQGFSIKTAGEATSLRATGVTPDYIDIMRAVGFELRSADEATSLRAVGVTPEFVREMRDLGFAVQTASEATSLAATGVTAEWVRQMKAAGVPMHSGEEASSLRALGVDPAFVERLAKAGYPDLTLSELQRLAAFGVNESFIREMEQYRTNGREPR